MSQISYIVLMLAIIILAYGLLHTYRIGQKQKSGGPYDQEVNKHVQAHPYTLNPVFISYIVALVLLIGYIVLLTFNKNGIGY